jgi:hypothetical protein
MGKVIAIVLVVGVLIVAAAKCASLRETDVLSTIRSPTELAPGGSFVCARGTIGRSARLEIELRQWQGGPLRAWVSTGGKVVASLGPQPGLITSACELPSGAFEVRVENADTVARTVDVDVRFAD